MDSTTKRNRRGTTSPDRFRNPKTYAYEGTKAASQPRIVFIRVRPRNVYASRGTTLSVTGVNELAAVQGRLTLCVSGADGSVVCTDSVAADLAEVPCGKGRLIVSQLRLVENLGHDAVADKILMNMVEFPQKDRDRR